MTDGRPDFAWADEEDGIAVIKHDSDHLWIEPYYQAKTRMAINGPTPEDVTDRIYQQTLAIRTLNLQLRIRGIEPAHWSAGQLVGYYPEMLS